MPIYVVSMYKYVGHKSVLHLCTTMLAYLVVYATWGFQLLHTQFNLNNVSCSKYIICLSKREITNSATKLLLYLLLFRIIFVDPILNTISEIIAISITKYVL